MAVVASRGRLVDLGAEETVPQTFGFSTPLRLTMAYETIWRTQPAVRTVCTFLARNIAQLGLHVFRRVSDTDRERVQDHPFANTIAHPNDDTTTYELIDALVNDLAIYDNAFWVKVRPANEPDRIGLVRIPPWRVEVRSDNWLAPTTYRVFGPRGHSDLDAEAVVHFRGYNPIDPRIGVSAIESLRRLLAEDAASNRYREQMWRSEARISGVIERPADVEWSDAARERFRHEWKSLYSANGSEAGGTPILEDGMSYRPLAYTAEQAQYVEARKLAREEVAAAYHIPPPMVGILEHATFSNVSEQHKNLYQDTLGPWLAQIAQRIDLRLLPDYPNSEDLYCEFNLAEKLRGSFEEQTRSLQVAVGAPLMTRNEGRARLNLPPVDGGDELVTPLNLTTDSDTVAPQPEELPSATASAAILEFKTENPGDTSRIFEDGPPKSLGWAEPFAEVVAKTFARQAEAIVPLLGPGKTKAAIEQLFDPRKWDADLAAELFSVNIEAATAAARRAIVAVGGNPATFAKAGVAGWLAANADGIAHAVNETTAHAVHLALLDPDSPANAVRKMFDDAIALRSPEFGVTQATAVAGFGSIEGAKHQGLTEKTWVVRSKNPRSTHAALNGVSVPVEHRFPNGARWPGDSLATPDERAGCTCELTFTEAP